jgi:hypothetical protein
MFEADLSRELKRCGIDGRRKRRIVAELRDHLACDPNAEIGSPRLIAERFAAELGVAETRRATYAGFLALAVTAILMGAAAAASSRTSPPGPRGVVGALAALGIVVACQVAFVGGILALWLLVRSETETRLIQRRMLVGLAAAAVAVACLGMQQLVLHGGESGWRRALVLVAIATAAPGLARAAVVLRRASMIASPAPQPVVSLPRWFSVGTGVLVCLAITIASGYAERSAVEGLIRGAFEAVAFAGGFLLLGRYMGLRRSIRHETVPTLRQ